MKVCYVVPDVMIPYHSGASTHVWELAKALVASGDVVHVVCRRRVGQLQHENISGVWVHRLFRGILGPLPTSKEGPAAQTGSAVKEGGSLYNAYLRTAFALYAGREAAKIVRANKLDAIVERETAFGAGAVASLVTNRPMVLELIGPRYCPLSMAICYRLFAYNESMVPNGAMSKVVYVNAAVDTGTFFPDNSARGRVRKVFGLEDQILVGYVGTLQKWHGIRDLLLAAQMASRTFPQLRFLLLGPQRDWVAGLVDKMGLQSIVILAGPVDYAEVPAYINACDILVAPYNIEGSERETKGIGSPLKVLEYMACGKPAIGSDLPTVASLIQDAFNGLLFPQGNVAALSDCIVRLATDEDLRRTLGINARKCVQASFTWRQLADQVRSALVEASNA